MLQRIQAIRGMHDILPDETRLWRHVEGQLHTILGSYGYQEIRLPILEMTDLFKRSVGEVTDIVEKEMYTFADRNDESVTLRPEGTAGCVRAAEENGLLFNQTQRLWYSGPMFRYERPQKGRYRQFHQLGIEAFGMAGPDIDAEMIAMTARFWCALGISDHVKLQINSIGNAASRLRFSHELVEYLRDKIAELDSDSQKRLEKNPLRILDSKNLDTQRLLYSAPSLADYLDEESREHFQDLQSLLSASGIPYQVNHRLVRGLDYYGQTVFEWVTEALGAQGTVCAGGRYNGLVEQLGGKSTPAVGCAMGMERLILLVESLAGDDLPEATADLYCIGLGKQAKTVQLAVAEQLRSAYPQIKVMMHCGEASLKNQLKKADKSGARFALVIGEEELQNDVVIIKPLRNGQEQKKISRDQLVENMHTLLFNEKLI